MTFTLGRSADRVEQGAALAAVADPLAALCASDASVRARVGAACDTAVQVTAERQLVATPGRNGIDGRDGADGMDGRDGRDGVAGKDGITPPCMATTSQCQGSAGADGLPGKDGTDGEDGTNGRDGSPAAELIVNRADGSQARCPRTGGDDLSPVYTCSTVPVGGA